MNSLLLVTIDSEKKIFMRRRFDNIITIAFAAVDD